MSVLHLNNRLKTLSIANCLSNIRILKNQPTNDATSTQQKSFANQQFFILDSDMKRVYLRNFFKGSCNEIN
ncbi:hypothetical protein [Algoriella sp.]|uniref:hypothetical protein n=1 Tax=Algoriella sp. TaxID=1872434 RepID=UPI002FCBE28A